MLGIDGKVLSHPPKKQIVAVVLRNLGKPLLLNFMDLSKIFCPRLK